MTSCVYVSTGVLTINFAKYKEPSMTSDIASVSAARKNFAALFILFYYYYYYYYYYHYYYFDWQFINSQSKLSMIFLSTFSVSDHNNSSKIICFWQYFLGNIAPVKYRGSTKINTWEKVIYSCLEDCKTTPHDYLWITHWLITRSWDVIWNNKILRYKTSVKS